MKQFESRKSQDRAVLSERELRGFEVVMIQLGETMGPDLIVGNVSGPMTQEVLREACYRVQQLHPTLRGAVRWPGGRRDQRPSLHTFAADRDALDVVVMDESGSVRDIAHGKTKWKNSHDAYWQWVAEEQSKHRFNLDEGFFFRVVWVPDQTVGEGHLIICSHHAIVDGTSLMRLLNQIMQNVDALHWEVARSGGSAIEATARLPAVVPLPTSPALFSHLRFGLLERALTWVGRKQAVSEQRQFIRRPWLPLDAKAKTPLKDLLIRTQCVFAQGEDARWEELHKRCKHYNVTVGGAFGAAVQFAISRYLREQGVDLPMKNGKVAIPLSMDYNMRDRVDQGSVDMNAIGLGTSIASVGVKVDEDIEFWDLAQRIMVNARKQVKYKMPKLFQSVTDTIFDYEGFWRRNDIDHGVSGGVGDGVNISNVGRYPFPTTLGQFTVKNIFGFNGACLSGPMFIFWLRHIDGHLCYNAITCSPGGNRFMLNTIFSNVVELMEQLAAQPSSHEMTLAGYSRRPAVVAEEASLASVN